NKTNPTLIIRIRYQGAYTHSCWTTDDHKYLFMTDEQDGQVARIWNIENLNNIYQVSQYSANLQSLVHNPYIRGRYAFIAHNTEGLRVVDIADPSVLVEVGFYDTYPGPSGGFNGLWSACPYLPSGKIVGGDRTGGLYVWKFNNTRAVRIYGFVRDWMGSPVPFARVSISHTGRTTLSDSTGTFKIGEERLETPGAYGFTLRAFAQGYSPDSTFVVIGQRDSVIGASIILRSSSTGVDDDGSKATQFGLNQNYPNPFNPTTELSFAIGRSSFATLKVHDLLGREVATLVSERLPAGEHKRTFDASNLPSGIYFYQLRTGSFVETKKMVMVR
ncbi:MAG: choice-of-anchor B family protein, partial [Bacteroidota bacterium]